MKILDTDIPDVKILEPRVYGDSRGFFMETWNKNELRSLGLDLDFVQDNHSKSGRNILRGLHYQIENPQGKLVRVVKGEVFDVAVDMRQSSPNFGRWVGVYLNDSNKRMLWIPPGFAHGFYVNSDCAEFLYKCTDYYYPEHERTLLWNDPDLSIAWPIAHGIQPILSEKDQQGALMSDSQYFL